MKDRIAIIGAGIGGLSAAIAMQKMGYDVTIYEKQPQSFEIGSGIILGANAMISLDYLGIGDQIREVAYEENVCTILSNKGKELTKLDYEGSPKSNYTFILRSDLVHILSSALQPDTIVFNKTIQDFEQDEKKITIHFQDGTTSFSHYMIASDGIFSTVRKKLLPEKNVRFAGYTCWRGVVENCPQYLEKKYTETWGPKGRIGIIPLSNNRMYWYVFKNCQAKDEELWQWKIQDLVFNFIDYHPPIQQIIEWTNESQVFQKDIYDLDPIYQFAFDRILLLGDAAHATTPNMGQGACQAIEDALFLALCLKNADHVQQAFIDYEKQRLDRTKKVIQDSWLLGKVAQLDIPLLCSVRNKMIELAPNKVHHKKLKSVFDIKPTVKA